MESVLFNVISTVLLVSAKGMGTLPQVVLKHGPLYEGLQLLIADEKLNSQTIWNNTQAQIDHNSKILNTTLNYMQNYEQIVDEKLKQLQEVKHYEAMHQCYTQYERQIARFNRDLIDKYHVCRQALNSSLSQLEEDIKNELFYIRDASIEVQELRYECNVTHLIRPNEDHFSAIQPTMCVISGLGDIKQRTLKASQIVLDVISRVIVCDMDHSDDGAHDENQILRPSGDNVCWEFDNLRVEFESIYERIMMCVQEV